MTPPPKRMEAILEADCLDALDGVRLAVRLTGIPLSDAESAALSVRECEILRGANKLPPRRK